MATGMLAISHSSEHMVLLHTIIEPAVAGAPAFRAEPAASCHRMGSTWTMAMMLWSPAALNELLHLKGAMHQDRTTHHARHVRC
jgi:hypothetical protein